MANTEAKAFATEAALTTHAFWGRVSYIDPSAPRFVKVWCQRLIPEGALNVTSVHSEVTCGACRCQLGRAGFMYLDEAAWDD